MLAATDDFIEHRLMGMRSDTVTRQLYCMRGDATMQPPANVHHRLVPTAVKPPSFRDAQAEYRRCIDAVRPALFVRVRRVGMMAYSCHLDVAKCSYFSP